MLSKDEKERLRGLSKEHAENIGLHILAAYTLEEDDPAAALEHAKWVARQASRIDFSRETLAFIAYRQGDYKLALREFRTAHRMNGFPDYLPFIADCERGLGDPKKAIAMATSDEGKALEGEAKAEMFLVYAGALGDLELWDKAIDVVDRLADTRGLPGAYRMRAIQAEQYFLEESGQGEKAADLDPTLDELENQYAEDDEDETSDDVVIDYDLEELPSAVLEKAGISWDDARYAPEERRETEESVEEERSGEPAVSTNDDDSSDGSSDDVANGAADGETHDAGDAAAHDAADSPAQSGDSDVATASNEAAVSQEDNVSHEDAVSHDDAASESDTANSDTETSDPEAADSAQSESAVSDASTAPMAATDDPVESTPGTDTSATADASSVTNE